MFPREVVLSARRRFVDRGLILFKQDGVTKVANFDLNFISDPFELREEV